MISGYTAADVRAAEEPLLAGGVPLMQHAAFALATRVAAELGARRVGTPGGAVRGASVVLLVGSGSNGGDALHAGALLARRGAGVLAVCTSDAPHAEGLAALRRAGGRAVRVTETGQLETVAAAYLEKYGADWAFNVDGDAFEHSGHRAQVYRIAPDVAFGFRRGATASQTRWTF